MCDKTLKVEKICRWSDLKKGDKFIVRGNPNSHNYPEETVLTMKVDGCGGTDTMCDIAAENTDGNVIHAQNVYKVIPANTVEDMKAEVVELTAELANLNRKIQFCEENGTTEFDETEYEIFAALDILEGKGTRKEKAALLSKILKSKK